MPSLEQVRQMKLSNVIIRSWQRGGFGYSHRMFLGVHLVDLITPFGMLCLTRLRDGQWKFESFSNAVLRFRKNNAIS